MPLNICTYWEGPVSWLERVCIQSMIAMGHEVEIFTSDVATLKATGLHHLITDVRDVLADSHPAYVYKSQQGGLRVFSDIARLAMLKNARGVWADADCLFIKPMMEDRDTIIGRASEKRVCNSVLLLQPESELLIRYFDAVSRVPLRAEWVNLRLRLQREWEIARGDKLPRHAGRSSIGPRAITHFVRLLGLESSVLPQHVFYPIHHERAHELVSADAGRVRESLTDDTRVVHVWQSTLGAQGLLSEHPPATSYLGEACRRLGV